MTTAQLIPTKIVRRNKTQFRVAKRCVAFFAVVCVLPVIFVLFVTTDQYMRPQQQRHLLEYESNASRYTNDIYVNYTAVEIRINGRRQHLRQVCHKYGLDQLGNDSLHRPNSWEFLVNRKHHIVWCNVFKAASTSWFYNFNLLAGYTPQFLKSTKLIQMNLARKKYPRLTLPQLEEAMSDSVSFLIVRHPLERILSGYRDKIQFSLPLTHHRKLGKMIIRKYRTSTNTNNDQPKWSTSWPTFSEFIRFLIDEHKAGAELDMHWTPITQFCTPCLLDFQVIIKFETLTEDQKYLIHATNLENLINIQWKNSMRGKGTLDVVPFYFKQLTKSQIHLLYQFYKYDFELFNYTLKGYIEHAMDDP